ncbi:MAG: hypothetical protein J6A03_08600 [Lachnospiraceae bacterium]|nr:hypothetical protein [Lachnospiraceae bacterium]
MDENYLDNLLNEISLDKEIDHNVEDELDHQLHKEKVKRQEAASVSRDDMFDMDLEQDASSDNLDTDVHFTEDQMNELDNLDNLADLDIGDLDFSDIDFDDLDVTKLDSLEDDPDLDALLKEFDGDLEIPDHFDEDITDKKDAKQVDDTETMEDSATMMEDDVSVIAPEDKTATDEPQDKNEPSEEEALFNADQFLDGLLNDEESEQAEQSPIVDLDEKENVEKPEEVVPDQIDDMMNMQEDRTDDPAKDEKETEESDDLDDLFSLLDLEDNHADTAITTENVEQTNKENAVTDTEETGTISELDDIEEVSEKKDKPKKSLMTILFGEPDEEDELSPEELEAQESAKAAKKAKKEAAKKEKEEKKAAAKAEKDAKAGEKKKSQEEKKRVRAVKKAERKQEEAKNAEPEKPLNRPAVIFIFTLFLGGTFLFYLATNNFNYTVAIQKATTYFENQKYHSAYDEIKGVDVKEKDKELKDRIYTVMYVERLYESYQNNLELGRQKKALDSLLRGVDKYYEYYEEAQQLGIVSDLDYSFAQIQNALQDNYGITVEQAVAMNQMESYEYVQAIDQYVTEQEVVR